MKNRSYRLFLACFTVFVLLLSGCGTEQQTDPRPAASKAALTETTVPETTVPETIQSETTAEMADPSDQPGLINTALPNGLPIYMVDLAEYLAANPDSVAPIAQPLNADFYGGGEDTSMACFFLGETIQNCTLLMVPMHFAFEGSRDPSEIEWGSFFLLDSMEESVLEDHGTYLELDPDHVVQAVDTFQLSEQNEGLFTMQAMVPYNVCAITVLPVAAPDGWDPFSVAADTANAVVGFPTERDRQVFLDSLAR